MVKTNYASFSSSLFAYTSRREDGMDGKKNRGARSREQGRGLGGGNGDETDSLGRFVHDMDMKNNRGERSRSRSRGRGRGHGDGDRDKFDALGRLLTQILRHRASELNLNMEADGFVKVQDLLRLNMKTVANIPMRSHTADDIREAVRRDDKQRFGLVEENGELLIRANQGHAVKTVVESASLLKPVLSTEEIPVCVHGTYKKNLESILKSGLKRMTRLHVHFSCGLPRDSKVISGMRRDVNVLIFLDAKKALEDGMKIYISDNKVILTEGFDRVVPTKYIQKMQSWPDRNPILFKRCLPPYEHIQLSF